MRLSREELKGLMKNKLIQAGLREDHADQTAEILTWAHERGFASHGAVRVESLILSYHPFLYFLSLYTI